MPNKFFNFIGGLPFLLLVADGGRKRIKMNWARVFEGVLIAAATAMLTAYVSMREMRVEVVNLKEGQKQIKEEFSDRMKCVEDRVYALNEKMGRVRNENHTP